MEPHGRVDLQWKKNILVVTTHGSFNIEGVTIAFDKIKQSVENSNYSTWYRVDILDDESLGSHEVMAVIGKSYSWSFIDSQCIEMAICCSNLLQQEMVKKFIEYSSLNIKNFNDIEQTNHYINAIHDRNID